MLSGNREIRRSVVVVELAGQLAGHRVSGCKGRMCVCVPLGLKESIRSHVSVMSNDPVKGYIAGLHLKFHIYIYIYANEAKPTDDGFQSELCRMIRKPPSQSS